MDFKRNVSSFSRLEIFIQHYLDRVTPHLTARWLFNLFLLATFLLRVILLQGFYIIAYGLGIFLLHHFVLFLTPKLDSSYNEDDDEVPKLPTKVTDEYRPFIRRLPEFKFWYTTFKALFFSWTLTCFPILDVPVYWPILVIYFIVLFLVTMRQRILHMIRYRYLPFSYGKIRYSGKNAEQQQTKVSTK